MIRSKAKIYNRDSIMNKKKYLLSGIGPGDDGVGRLMKALAPEAESKGFKVLYKLTNRFEENKKTRFGYALNLVKRTLTFLRKISVNINISLVSNANILVIHPQTVGFNLIFKISRKNKIYLYLMDNSFFCIRSYNINPVDKNECLQCIGDPRKAGAECYPWPVQHNREEAILQLKKLMRLSKEIVFLVQNKLQEKLVKTHFGDVETFVVGLRTIEFSKIDSKIIAKEKKYSDNVVYHGATHYAKGIDYFVNLAKQTPELKFIIPDAKESVESYLGRKISTENLIFIPCTWETGLKELVCDAAIVVNPSLWSAPIEGALLKSIAFNGCVATVKTQYGYEAEISDYHPILRLSQKVEEGSEQLLMHIKYLKSKEADTKNILINTESLTMSLMNPLDAVK